MACVFRGLPCFSERSFFFEEVQLAVVVPDGSSINWLVLGDNRRYLQLSRGSTSNASPP
jgi:hypothetical protein